METETVEEENLMKKGDKEKEKLPKELPKVPK